MVRMTKKRMIIVSQAGTTSSQAMTGISITAPRTARDEGDRMTDATEGMPRKASWAD